MATIELKVPDIGDFESVEVIELLVQPGSLVQLEQSLVTVESEKASMEIPAGSAGRVVELKVKLGDKVKEGSVIALVEPIAGEAAVTSDAAPAVPSVAVELPAASTGSSTAASSASTVASTSLAASAQAPSPASVTAAASAPAPASVSAPSTAVRTPPVLPEPGEEALIVKPHASP
ncbi:MAG: dihydrolipoyllysine-residue acetyltransferase, partial [Pseudomonadota bacterium]